MQIIEAKEMAVVLEILNNVVATMEFDETLDMFTSNDALLIILGEQKYNDLKSTIKKLS